MNVDPNSAESVISQYILDTSNVVAACASDPLAIEFIVDTAKLLRDTFESGNKLMTAGNGGSFADSIHVAAEFIGRLRVERPPVPVFALGTNGSSWSAIANDYSGTSVFARELLALANRGDALIVFSTSGQSENMIEVLEIAKKMGVTTLGFLGKSGGACVDLCQRSYVVDSDTTEYIQAAHITMAHALCASVDAYLGFDHVFFGSRENH